MQTFEEKQQALQTTIDDLYVAFSSYELRVPVHGCECCVGKDDIKRLQSKPLRQLDEDDLSKYSGKAMTTWGDEYDFKHFLPRLLELLVTVHGLPFGVAFLPNKLNFANWKTWPQGEKHAIENVLIALWNYDLAGGETGDCTGSWLEAISQVVEDATPLLQMWENEYSIDSCEALRDFIINLYSQPRTPQIENWLCSDALLQRFEQRFDESKNEEQSDICAQIVDALTNFRSNEKVRIHGSSNPN